ncbi:MAG: 2-dehydro-3-deoxygalactonokinase [Pseudooceanicola sp.]
MTRADWIAADWGTTHLRIWAIGQEGEVLASRQSDRGMGRLAPAEFEPALLDLASDLVPEDGCDVLICGMAGARQGWAEAPYAGLPWRPEATGAVQVRTADPRLSVRILPGLMQADPPDVMRGEETQAAGYLASVPNFDGVLCLPGTHTKWIRCAAGVIVEFRTFMTGELFSALGSHTILRHGLGAGWDDTSFLEGAAAGFAAPERIGADLFGLRAAGLLGGLTGDAARARLSGLLIGAELAGAAGFWRSSAPVLVGAPGLCALYAHALSAQGCRTTRADAGEMVLSGLRAARLSLKDDAS